MRAGSPAIPGLNKLAGEVVEVTLTLSLTLRSQQYGILKYTRDPLLRGAHKSVQKSSLDLILHVGVDFHCENIFCNDIILLDYRKCDFGADFHQKLQILILL